MRIAFIFAAATLWCSSVFAASDYNEWALDKLNRDAIALSNKDMRMVGDRILVAGLGFICNRQSKAIGVTLIPFGGSYKNQQRHVSVLVQKSADTLTESDLSQKWQNGFKYIFSNDPNAVEDLITYFKINEYNGIDFAHFLFSGDFNEKSDALNHVALSLSGFSKGFETLNKTCRL